MALESRYSLNLRYSVQDEGYIVKSPEFPGLSAFGPSPEDAILEARQALELFIESFREEGKELPPPNLIREYSGQIRVRLPKSLHARLASRAEEEGISLNTLIIQYLSEGISLRYKSQPVLSGTEEDPLNRMGKNPVSTGVRDASVHHDR